MDSMTIRDLDDELMRLLQLRARQNRRSIEEEACSILRAALADPCEDNSAGAAFRNSQPDRTFRQG